MSLFEQKVSFLSWGPKVWREGHALKLRTNAFLQFLSLFSYNRSVAVDPLQRRIIIDTRYLWFLKVHQEIPFARVVHIDHQFDSMGTDWSYFQRTDQIETFTVSVVLRDPEDTVPLARFRGEGSCMTGTWGVLLGDDVLDHAGDQGDMSRDYVSALQRLLRVPIGRPVPHFADADGVRYRCTSCNRNSPPRRTKCQYCGGPVRGIG